MENEPLASNTFSLDIAGKEQLQNIGKWSRFIGVVFIIFGSILLLATVLLLANFEALMTEIIKLNGIDEEMIDMLEKGGKYFIAFALVLSSVILFINGFLLFRFGSKSSHYLGSQSEYPLIDAFTYLKKYIYFSFVLACISAILSLISTIVFFGGTH